MKTQGRRIREWAVLTATVLGILAVVIVAGCDREGVLAPEAPGGLGAAKSAVALSPKETVGKLLFFDTNLSSPTGQSCATCHDPAFGFADPRPTAPTSQGIVPNFFGNRNSPTVAYASFSPDFHYLPNMGPMNMGVYEGGQNWDGKASNLVEQAKLPFLNPLEMHNRSAKAVVAKVERSAYGKLFREIYGRNIFDDVDAAYQGIADAIAAYEASAEVNRFSSKYDRYLRGETTLSEQETRGLAVFEGQGNCARCHRSAITPDGLFPMFTSRHHANVGVPRNDANPYYTLPPSLNPLGFDYVELGTGAIVDDTWHYGRVKIPTLRNVALTPPYMHNGFFADLTTVVNFYNTRDVPGAGWAPPEVPSMNIIRMFNLGNLGLTEQQVQDVVAFLHTLTDE